MPRFNKPSRIAALCPLFSNNSFFETSCFNTGFNAWVKSRKLTSSCSCFFARFTTSKASCIRVSVAQSGCSRTYVCVFGTKPCFSSSLTPTAPFPISEAITGTMLRKPVFFSKSETVCLSTFRSKASNTACSLGFNGASASKSGL